MFVRRAVCIRCVKWVLGTVFLCMLLTFYLILARMTAEDGGVNKVAKVVDLVVYKESEVIPGEETEDNIESDALVNEEEEAPEKEDIKIPADGWIEDKEEKIMDAKVMRNGNKKLIIVDLPNPKDRWVRPNEY